MPHKDARQTRCDKEIRRGLRGRHGCGARIGILTGIVNWLRQVSGAPEALRAPERRKGRVLVREHGMHYDSLCPLQFNLSRGAG